MSGVKHYSLDRTEPLHMWTHSGAEYIIPAPKKKNQDPSLYERGIHKARPLAEKPLITDSCDEQRLITDGCDSGYVSQINPLLLKLIFVMVFHLRQP